MYAIFSPPQYRLFNFFSCLFIAVSIGYFSRIPWRWRVVSGGTDKQIMIANALVALIWGYVMIFSSFMLAMLITKGPSGMTVDFFRIVRLISMCAFVFPIIGYYAVFGDEHQRRTQRLLHAKAYQEKLAQQAQMMALRSQINPHFFFNALNAVAALIPTRPADAERAVELLATALRPVLMRDQPMINSLESELTVARAYAEIEKLRLGGRIEFTFDVEEAALPRELPSLSLQPLIENAVRHGAMMTEGPYRIETIARVDNDVLLLEIRNAPRDDFARTFANPQGLAPMPKGHALNNILARLHALFGNQSLFSVTLCVPGPAAVAKMVIHQQSHAS
ncbi:histidine kinase [Candidatus Sumerlaeota bacterium]|nr:histidine kinase [Candidatus Sumerlaeota bacterium]